MKLDDVLGQKAASRCKIWKGQCCWGILLCHSLSIGTVIMTVMALRTVMRLMMRDLKCFIPSDLCPGSHLKVTVVQLWSNWWLELFYQALPPQASTNPLKARFTFHCAATVLDEKSFQSCGKRLDLPNHVLKVSSCFATRTWRSS